MAKTIRQLARPVTSHVTNLKELGDWIRARRTELRLRIDDAAALCGVSVQLLSSLENGKRPVGIDKLLQIAANLGLAVCIHPTDGSTQPIGARKDHDGKPAQ